MRTELPDVIARFYAAQASDDLGAMAGCFAKDATVRDEGATHAGGAAIAAWMADAKARYQHTAEVLDVHEDDGDVWRVSVRVSGRFPNSPVILEQSFGLAGDAIRSLETH